MSNDTEFDAVVSFWSERGMNVSRVPRLIYQTQTYRKCLYLLKRMLSTLHQ